MARMCAIGHRSNCVGTSGFSSSLPPVVLPRTSGAGAALPDNDKLACRRGAHFLLPLLRAGVPGSCT